MPQNQQNNFSNSNPNSAFNPNAEVNSYQGNSNFQPPSDQQTQTNQGQFNPNQDYNQSNTFNPQNNNSYNQYPQDNYQADPNLQNNAYPSYPAEQNQAQNQNFDQTYNSQNLNNPNQDSNYQNNNFAAQDNFNSQDSLNSGYYNQSDSNQSFNQSYPSENQVDTLNYQGYPQNNETALDPNYSNPYSNTNQSNYIQPASYDLQNSRQNKFKEKKAGSNLFLYIAIGVVAVLLISTVIIFFLISSRNSENQSEPQGSNSEVIADIPDNSEETEETGNSDSENSETSNSSLDNQNANFDPNNTPAENAIINDANSIPPNWLSQYFFNNEVDQDGNCDNLTFCGIGADPDNDGLTNLEEYNYGTDPQKNDTDSDGISDGNEVNVYLTNPKEKDSDIDGTNDNIEIVSCYDPILDSANRMNPSRLQDIESKVSLRPLRETTIRTLQQAGATEEDIEKGYIADQCGGSSIEI